MARTTKNRLVENEDNNTKKTTATGAPAVETENARFQQLTPFRQANVAASQAGVALRVAGTDTDDSTKYIAARAGRLTGLAWALTAAATHTAGSIQLAVGPAGGALAAVGTSMAIDGGGTSAVVDQAGSDGDGIPFNEGDAIGVLVTTDGAFTPITTDLMVWPVVRWAAGGTPNA